MARPCLWIAVPLAVWLSSPPIAPLRGGPIRRGRLAEAPPHRAPFGRLPLSFEVNRGQWNPQVRFSSRGRGYDLFLTNSQAVLALAAPRPSTGAAGPRPLTTVGMSLVGASGRAQAEGAAPLPGRVNYFVGSDRSRWRTNVPTYGRVRYRNVYPGVDQLFYGHQGALEYDLVVAPHARPDRIRLRFAGTTGLLVDSHGNLVLRTPGGELIQHRPVIYQEVGGSRKRIDGGYRILPAGKRPGTNAPQPPSVAFQLARYDVSRPLVIDPTLVYSTFLGGSGGDSASAVTVDAAQSAYVTGPTLSTDFPTAGPSGPYQATPKGHPTVFVSKFNPGGSALVYSTYIGGSNGDIPAAIAVDGQGNAYVTGVTYSTDYPTAAPSPQTHVFQRALNGYSDAFLTKLAPNGNALVYSTYFGGGGVDYARGVAVDALGSAYIAGSTFSTDLPTTSGVFRTTLTGTDDAFVAKFDPTGSVLPYSTYVGGTATDEVYGLAVDHEGRAYVTGFTLSGDFPTVNPVQAANAGAADAFVFELNPTGTALLFSSYFGGSDNDFAYGIALDPQENFVITGHTFSANLTMLNAFQPQLAPYPYGGSGCDAFVTKFKPGGAGLGFSTYLGGNLDDEGKGIAVDRSGNVWVTGVTYSRNPCSGDLVPNTPPFPTLNPLQAVRGGPSCIGAQGVDNLDDAFVTAFDKSGTFLFSTYLGGTQLDDGTGVAVDDAGSAYTVGETASPDFPTKSPAFGFNNDFDAFLTKWTGLPQVPLSPSDLVATAVSSSEIDLTWTDRSDNETGFSVEWMPPGSTSFTQLGTAAAVSGTGSVIHGKVVHLNAQSTYSFRITAFNAVGASPPTPTATATTLSAGPPAKIKVSPTKINFGTTSANPSQPPTRSLTVKNIGGQILIGSVGTLSSPFSVQSGGGSFSLTKNQSVTVTLQFAPTTAGHTSTSTLTISSNDTTHATTKVPVTGKSKR